MDTLLRQKRRRERKKQMKSHTVARLPLLAFGMLALLGGLAAGLLRLGWAFPAAPPALPAHHGPLMIAGFLGTLISLERAVALSTSFTTAVWRQSFYLAPLLTGLGAITLLSGAANVFASLLLTLGSAGLVVLSALVLYVQPTLFNVTMWAAALCLLIGDGLWVMGWPIFGVVLWWTGFPVLTIAGERLELSRLMRLSQRVHLAFLLCVGLLLIGMSVSHLNLDLGVRVSGLGLIALALWLQRYDIAWRTVHQPGLPGFIAVCLLLGYVWLGIGGLLALYFGGSMAGPSYDAMLHAIFLGFVFAMIFGHAPIIFPIVLGWPVRFRPAFYSHLILLQLSLLLRVAGDIAAWWPGREWGGLLNVAAVLFFLVNTIRSIQFGALHLNAASRSAQGRSAKRTTAATA
jgi:hypothetical protein